MCRKPSSFDTTRPHPRETQRKPGYSPEPHRSSRRDHASRKRPRHDVRNRYPYSDTSSDYSDYSDYSESTDSEHDRYDRSEQRYSRDAPSRGDGSDPRYRSDEYGRDRYPGHVRGRGENAFGSDAYEQRRERDRYWDRKRPYGYRRHPDRRVDYGSVRRERRPDYRRYERSSDDGSYHSRYDDDCDRYRDRRRDDRYRGEPRSVKRDQRDRYPDQRNDRNNVRPSDNRNGSDEERPRRPGREGRDREDDGMAKRYSGPERPAEMKRSNERPDEKRAQSKERRVGNGLKRDGNDIDDAKATSGVANRGAGSNRPPGKEETYWQRRRRMRENNPCSPVWDVSPSPPHRIEDRFEVGADERQKKERKRQRKEERRAKREAKRARKAANDAETTKKPEQPALPQNPEKPQIGPQITAAHSDEEEEVVGPALPPSKEKSKLDYGKALRPGEGSKMAAFVQDGARIPRRGEIGLTSDEISKYEVEGYVMSGSRNQRMEAVRMRKENQVYSAEELAALSQFSREERKAREERMLGHFRTLVEAKRKEAEASKHGQVENDNPV